MTHKDEAAPSREGADIRMFTAPRRVAETLVLTAVFVLAILFFIGSQAIRSDADEAISAHTFPEALSVLLLVATAIGIVAALRLPSNNTVTVKRPFALLGAMALLLAFPVMLEWLGYYILIVPWLLFFGVCARVRSPLLIAINLVTVLFVARVVFQMILGTPMP